MTDLFLYLRLSIQSQYLMQTEPNKNAEESAQNQEDSSYIPYNGFVNVNDIVKKRRQLRNAEFNVADTSWDINLDQQPKENH